MTFTRTFKIDNTWHANQNEKLVGIFIHVVNKYNMNHKRDLSNFPNNLAIP